MFFNPLAELKCNYNNIPQFRSIFSCEKNVQAAAEMLEDAGFEVSVTKTDLGSKESILALVEYATGKGGTLSVYGDTAEYDCPPVCLCLLSVDIELLLSAKLQNDTFSLSATPINRRCGFLFRKVSPLSQRVKVRRVVYRGYPESSTNLFLDARRNYSSQCST